MLYPIHTVHPESYRKVTDKITIVEEAKKYELQFRMEIKKIYCDVETMFRKIYERLATNEWKIEVYHGNTSEFIEWMERVDYDFVEKGGFDELLIEKSPKVNFPPSGDLDWTPIVLSLIHI